MAIKSGAQYLDSLRDGRDVWMHGKRVADVTGEPGLASGARTLADFIDRQRDPAHVDKLTFVENGER
ncbi:MAG: 4-hydroxyphenylacetate 3-monooxygenase, partial [Gammaproteobacteria bacterium]|nr:4-hydroxyphenylacetate 3-monooxygenase [Gammaproteobacteria bacterium]